MKRCLCLLALLLLVPSMAMFAKGTGESTGAKAPVELELAHFSHFGDVSDNPDLKEAWKAEMEKKFGIKVKMNLIPRNNYLEKLYLMVASGELHGIIRVFSPADIMKFIQDESVIPFDDYLKNNAIWKKEFEPTGNYFSYEGKVWAITDGYVGNIFARYWRQDWLDKLGLKLPETIDELYTAAKMFTENDPDGNGKADTTGLTNASVCWNIQDIFHAYDAKINNIGGNAISWDPLTGAWDDSTLKPGMVDALKMINRLYKNKYLDNEFATNSGSNMRDRLISGKYGSAFYWASWGITTFEPSLVKNVPTGRVSIAVATKGTRTTMLNQYVAGGSQHVLIKGTKNPQAQVDAFINTFFGSIDGNLIGRLGIEGKNYRKEGTKIIQLKDPKTNNLIPTAGLCGVIPPLDFDKYPVVPDGPVADQQTAIDLNNKVKKVNADALASKLVFDASGIRDSPFSTTYTTLQNDINRLFNEVVIKSATGELAPEDAIKNYRETMKKIGAQKALDEMNAFMSKSLGKTVAAKYAY